MANELTLSASIKFAKGNRSANMSKSGLQLDVTGTNYVSKTQVVGTTAEALDKGEMTTPGYVLIKNNDTTNFVEVRDGSGGADVVKIRAGGFALFQLATATPFVIADTAACEIEYVLIEA